MKKILVLFVLFDLIALSACAGTTQDVSAIIAAAAYHIELPAEPKNLKLGVVPGPYGDMFMEAIHPRLAAKGYTVELVSYGDFIKPNQALSDKEIDMNMFQHYQYLNNFKFVNDLDLSAITEVPTVSMAVFSTTYKDLEDIENGATVSIPDDATNLARALRVLEAAGVITIDSQIDKSRATEADVSKNPKRLVFDKIEAPKLVDELPKSGLAVINGNFAYAGGLDISGALYNEFLQEGYVNVIAVRTEDLARQFVKDILDIVHSDEFKSFITDVGGKYNGFQRPSYFLY